MNPWNHRPSDKDTVSVFYSREPDSIDLQLARHANTLGEGPNQIRRPKGLVYERWWFVLAEVIVLSLGILVCCYEAGCFGK